MLQDIQDYDSAKAALEHGDDELTTAKLFMRFWMEKMRSKYGANIEK